MTRTELLQMISQQQDINISNYLNSLFITNQKETSIGSSFEQVTLKEGIILTRNKVKGSWNYNVK